VLDAERVGERFPLEPALERSRSAGLRRFEFELERVDHVVEEVRLSDRDAAEGDIGEVDLRRLARSTWQRRDRDGHIDKNSRRGHGNGLQACCRKLAGVSVLPGTFRRGVTTPNGKTHSTLADSAQRSAARRHPARTSLGRRVRTRCECCAGAGGGAREGLAGNGSIGPASGRASRAPTWSFGPISCAGNGSQAGRKRGQTVSAHRSGVRTKPVSGLSSRWRTFSASAVPSRML
jgi:hypothetical protein